MYLIKTILQNFKHLTATFIYRFVSTSNFLKTTFYLPFAMKDATFNIIIKEKITDLESRTSNTNNKPSLFLNVWNSL
jgi:hypothetical protein